MNKMNIRVHHIVSVIVVGVIASIVFHEVFHVLMHLGNVARVEIFPGKFTICEIVLKYPENYDLDGEEVAAYLISTVTLLVTGYMASRMYDSMDSRRIKDVDILAGNMNRQELIEGATRIGLI